MLGRLLLLLILLPILEIALLVWLAGVTSWWFVLGLLVAAALLGSFLARQQGIRSLGRISRQFNDGQLPADAVFDAVLVSLAGFLLILPGLLSDVAALGLLLPPTRAIFKAAVRRRFRAHVSASHYQSFDSYSPRDQIIDVEVLDTPQTTGQQSRLSSE